MKDKELKQILKNIDEVDELNVDIPDMSEEIKRLSLRANLSQKKIKGRNSMEKKQPIGRRNKIWLALSAICIAAVIFLGGYFLPGLFAIKNPGGSGPDGSGPDGNASGGSEKAVAITKYQASPYSVSNPSDVIKYSYTYENYDFYYIYLGEMANIPLYYQDAEYHSGVNFKYSFSTTDTSTETIEKAITTSSTKTKGVVAENSETTIDGERKNLELGLNVKFEAGAFGGKLGIEGSVKRNAETSFETHISNSTTNSFQKTKSLENTVKNGTAKTSSTTLTREFNLTKEDKIGYYRYTLFSASDTYLFLIKDSTTGKMAYEFKEHVIPDAYFWKFDYSETPSFRKSDTTGFELDLSILDNLPKPELCLKEKPSEPGEPGEPGEPVKGEIAIAAGSNHYLLIDAFGNLWAWGNNDYGQLGDGTTTTKLAPVPITIGNGTKKIKAISAGTQHSLAIDEEGDLWAWGRNQYGQLGNATTEDVRIPVQVNVYGRMGNKKAKVIKASTFYSFAIDIEGNLLAWGCNDSGQLGNKSTTSSNIPVQINTNGRMLDREIVAIESHVNNSLAIDIDGCLWSWGSNYRGQIGDGTTTSRIEPIMIMLDKRFKAIAVGGSHNLALDVNGNLWAWGEAFNGALGVGDSSSVIYRDRPVQINTNNRMNNNEVVAISATGSNSFAIDVYGNLWAWGRNDSGLLGNNTTNDSNVPILTNTNGRMDNNKAKVVAVGGYVLAIDVFGNLWAWGTAYSGQLKPVIIELFSF